MKKLFRITDPEVLDQFRDVHSVLTRSEDDVQVAYQSNWYMVVACRDIPTARLIISRLHRIGRWEIENKPGRKGRYQYIQIKFNREKS